MRLGADFLSILVIFSALAIVLGRWYENAMIFEPEKEFSIYPSDLGLYPEEAYLESGGMGDSLHSWYFNGGGEFTILYVHGNAGNLSDRLPMVKGYVEKRFNVLIFDYRGYGKSGGKPTKKNIVEDTFTAFDYLVNIRKTPPDKIIILGQSLGGAPALKVANARGCRGIVLEGVFYSIREIAKDIFGPIPIWTLSSSDFNNGTEVKKLSIPVLLIHGKMDTVIPIRHSEKLFSEANEPKSFEIFESATHVDMFEAEPERYFNLFIKFAERN